MRQVGLGGEGSELLGEAYQVLLRSVPFCSTGCHCRYQAGCGVLLAEACQVPPVMCVVKPSCATNQL